MCLAIPGKIVEIVDVENRIAKVEVGGVKRNINIGMLPERRDTHRRLRFDSRWFRDEQG